ncbi:Signal transduction histidine kinase [Chitinophaga eiseniae]|uniref:histidine kinase n=2 Tax=Chitinophaga eiseniae TaxID=634771 RepID=A0A1T4SX46_9BACT|nr:Signal transduction histidine kinase [Chitinophaga eiseniae]
MHQLNTLLIAGTQGMLAEDKGRVIVVNALCLLTVLLASVMGTAIFIASRDIGVLIAAWTEAAVFSGIIWLNSRRRHLLAAMLFILLHNVAVIYFGIWRQMTKEEELLTVFLCITSALIFKPIWHSSLAWLFCLFVIVIAYGVTRRGIIAGEPLPVRDLYANLGLMAILLMTFFAILLSKYYDMRLNELLMQRSFRIRKYVHQLEDYNKQLEGYSKQLESEVARRTDEVTRYAETVIHEMRNHAVSQQFASETVLGYLKYSEDGSKFETIDDPSRLKAVIRYLSRKFGMVHRISRSIKETIDNTLDTHKIGDNRFFDFNMTDVDLRSWSSHLTEVMQLVAAKDSVDISLEFDNGLPEVIRTDGHLLNCAVRNLLNNAIDFSPEHGNIRLAILQAPSMRELYIEVEDQGPGILREHINEIFKPYYTRRKGGTGLGLALVSSAIDHLGGKIEVTSTIGKGSIFRIVIPLIVGEKQVETAEKTFTLNVERALRILITDDNRVNRMFFSGMAKKLGCAAITANDANSCIEKVILERPDLLLLDIHMEGISGIEALRTIRTMTDPELSRMPVIIATANTSEELPEELAALQPDAFLYKPFEAEDIVSSINMAMDKAKARMQEYKAQSRQDCGTDR